MAPEQLRATRNVGVETDIWGLGSVLYELLTGSAPYPADSLQVMCTAIPDQGAGAHVGVLRPDKGPWRSKRRSFAVSKRIWKPASAASNT